MGKGWRMESQKPRGPRGAVGFTGSSEVRVGEESRKGRSGQWGVRRSRTAALRVLGWRQVKGAITALKTVAGGHLCLQEY